MDRRDFLRVTGIGSVLPLLPIGILKWAGPLPVTGIPATDYDIAYLLAPEETPLIKLLKESPASGNVFFEWLEDELIPVDTDISCLKFRCPGKLRVIGTEPVNGKDSYMCPTCNWIYE